MSSATMASTPTMTQTTLLVFGMVRSFQRIVPVDALWWLLRNVRVIREESVARARARRSDAFRLKPRLLHAGDRFILGYQLAHLHVLA